jgi:hypothetical protein
LGLGEGSGSPGLPFISRFGDDFAHQSLTQEQEDKLREWFAWMTYGYNNADANGLEPEEK